MKTILLGFSLLILQVGFSQERRVEYRSFTTKSGEVITDTIVQVMKAKENINQTTGDVIYDTAWAEESRTDHIKEYRNATLPSTSKGTVSVAILFNNNFESEDNPTQFRIGYFVKNNFLLGAGFWGKYDFDASDLTSFQLSLFTRKYLGGRKSKTFLELGADADFVNNTNYFGLGIGKTYFIGSNFGIDLGIKYITDFQASGVLAFGLAFQGFLSNNK